MTGSPYRAGMTRRRPRLPDGRPLPLTLWYPAHAAETAEREGIYDILAARDAPPAPGRFGLILLSHGSGGSEFNHHDWAGALARAGFVVAAPRHMGDSRDRMAGVCGPDHALARPRQLRFAAKAALEDTILGDRVDAGRMGVMGFSAGGYTALLLLGARPDFAWWSRHLRNAPGTEPPSQTSPDNPADNAPAIPAIADEDWRDATEPGIRAGVLLAPLATPFSPAELARITAPLRLYRTEKDGVTPNRDNADRLAGLVRGPIEVATKPGGHYVFIAPVDAATADRYPVYYRDEPGVDRAAVHRETADELVAYFSRTLNGTTV